MNMTKKQLAKLPANLRREYVAKKRAKQLERVLLPDAPPRRRARKVSLTRSECRLVPGTPAVPPPPKPKHWQQLGTHENAYAGVQSPPPGDKLAEELQGTSQCASESIPPLMCDWTTGELRSRSQFPDITKRRKPSATVTSADVEITSPPGSRPGSPPPPLLLQPLQLQTIPQEDLDTAQDETIVLEWLDSLSDADEEAIDVQEFGTNIELTINYAGEESANLPEDTDVELGQWLTDQDLNADRTVTAMLPEDSLTFDWSSNPDSFLGQREEFTGDSGPTFPILDSTRPIDVFLRFFDEDVLDIIVSETNREFGSIAQPLTKYSRMRRFKETDRNEMAVFIAVLIFQGLVPLPVEKDYFQENGYLTMPYFKSLMPFNRFMVLKRLLHFTNNATSTQNMPTDQRKLRKMGPLLDLLNNKFSTLYLPSRNIAIDESLLKWHRCLSFAQKIATKAAKVGVKSYELCESSTGYLWKFIIYTGKGMQHGQTDDTQQTDREDGQVLPNITARIVDDLVKPLLNRGHTLTMDNFYNSPLLARYLKTNKTDCLGTLRVNRDFVPASIKGISKSELRPGEIVHSYCRDLSIFLWRDNNLVSMISTFHKGDIGGREKHETYRYKPQAVLDYNQTMGGVDKKDQLLSAHPMERNRNQAWYKKLFRRLLNATVLNAYIIYKTRFPKMTQRQFRVQLANELVEAFKIEVPSVTEVEVLRIIPWRKYQLPILRGNHFIGQGALKYTRCVWCKKSRSRFICKQCNVALCLVECFEQYHTNRVERTMIPQSN